MSYRPTTNEPDLETIGRFLQAHAEWKRQSAETEDAFAVFLLDLARKTNKPDDGDQDEDT